MAGWNFTEMCCDGLDRCSENKHCPTGIWGTFIMSMEGYMWGVNALLVINTVLAGVIVAFGAYGQRYRYHRFTRFIFLGATTLFLPILTYVIPTSGRTSHSYTIPSYNYWHESLLSMCNTGYTDVVIAWAYLVQIAVIGTATVVAVDEREGPSTGPPFELLVQGVWTFYLAMTILMYDEDRYSISSMTYYMPFVVICAKIVLQYYAFGKAQHSLALALNPRLVFGYLQQLQFLEEAGQLGESVAAEHAHPPPLLVMGEEEREVEKQPWGYVFKDDAETMLKRDTEGLVTVDRVWQLDHTLAMPRPQLRDLCLSFALFKLLRCRFARYKLTDTVSIGTTIDFFWSLLLKDGEHARVFGVVADELSFVHDYYYSSLPIYYTNSWLPIVSMSTSLLSIACCILVAALALPFWGDKDSQLFCETWCMIRGLNIDWQDPDFGNSSFYEIPFILLVTLVMTAEGRNVASYICSNWTKVGLACRYVYRGRASLQHTLSMPKWVGIVLRCRCKQMKHWDEKVGQCSVLARHPIRTIPSVILWGLLCLPDHKRKVKVPEAVKISIIHELRRTSRNNDGRRLSDGTSSLRQSQAGESLLWACSSGKGTSDTILTWHVATSILEVRYPYPHDQQQASSHMSHSDDHKIAATHLSRYCAYLVAWSPELLPDDDAWSKSLYEAVKKEAERVLLLASAGRPAVESSSTPEVEYQRLEMTNEGEQTAWETLAGFWAEMTLYVAPSDNLEGHKKAIARGGELITLLWALLFHAGIVSRPAAAV